MQIGLDGAARFALPVDRIQIFTILPSRAANYTFLFFIVVFMTHI